MAGDWFDQNGAGSAVDVRELLDGLGQQAVMELVEAGALVSLGLTSDGGALGLTVTVDGRWRREYFRNAVDLQAWVAEAIPAVETARGQDRPSAVPGKRQRRSRGL